MSNADVLTPAATDFLNKFGTPGLPGLPKYAQLRETLYAAIRAGHWQPGGRLPTETELTRVTGFSLGTVQRALRELADEGIVVRSQGSGTYVAEGKGPIDEPLHLRFLGGEGEPTFLPLFPKVISRARIQERGPWSQWLAQTGADIVRIDRQLSVNGEFSVYNRFYFNAGTFPEITARPLATLDGVNLKQLLGGGFNMPITNVQQTVSLVKFSAEASAAIGVKPGTRGMLLESAGAAGRGTPIYFLESFIPPNSRRLDVSSI
jgi:DNA-binding GntR family transcriptional regulator